LTTIKDFEVEFFQGWFRLVVLLDVDVGGRTFTVRVPVKIDSDLQTEKERIKMIVQKFREFETTKLETLRQQYKGREI